MAILLWFGVLAAVAGDGEDLPSPWASLPAPPETPGAGTAWWLATPDDAATPAPPPPAPRPAPPPPDVVTVAAAREVTTVDPALHPGAWGIVQAVELPVPADLRAVDVHDDVSVDLVPARTRRVLVHTDPGLLEEARYAIVEGRLSLYHESEAPPPRYDVEGPLPPAVRADGEAVVDVPAWVGDRLDLWAYGDAAIDVSQVRAKTLVVIARDRAQVRVTGPCAVDDLRVDVADEGSFAGCGS